MCGPCGPDTGAKATHQAQSTKHQAPDFQLQLKAIGKKYDKDHKELAFDVKVGDTVLLPKYGGTEVKIEGKKLQLVREEDLLGVIEK